MIKNKILALLVCFIFLGITSLAEVLIGTATHIHDGDTFKLLQKDGTLIKIRLANIDAPEINQQYGVKSRDFLKQLINQKRIKIKVQEKDRYQRIVGIVHFNNLQINQLMVQKGQAWHYPKYSKDKKNLTELQNEARNKKIGLWKESHPLAPWEYRKQSKQKQKTTEKTFF